MLFCARTFLCKLAILPPISNPIQKRPPKSKRNPYLRTLAAEPLEERLPVSSSAAGVLFGLGSSHRISPTGNFSTTRRHYGFARSFWQNSASFV